MDKIATRTNLVWLNIVGLLLIVALVSHQPDSEEIYRYVSFAASISSILLAAVAIIYSMIANRGIDQSLSEVRSSAQLIAHETSRLNSASQGLSDEAEEAIQRLATLPTEWKKVSGELGTKIDDALSSAISESAQSEAKLSEGQFNPDGTAIPTSVALYAIYLAHETGQAIRVDEIFDPESGDQGRFRDYMRGYIECFKAYNPFGVEIEGLYGLYSVSHLGCFDLSLLKQRLDKLASENFEYLTYFDRVRSSFGLDPLAEPMQGNGDQSDHAQAFDDAE